MSIEVSVSLEVRRTNEKDTSMRKSLLDQLPLVPVAIDHDIARELGR